MLRNIIRNLVHSNNSLLILQGLVGRMLQSSLSSRGPDYYNILPSEQEVVFVVPYLSLNFQRKGMSRPTGNICNPENGIILVLQIFTWNLVEKFTFYDDMNAVDGCFVLHIHVMLASHIWGSVGESTHCRHRYFVLEHKHEDISIICRRCDQSGGQSTKGFPGIKPRRHRNSVHLLRVCKYILSQHIRCFCHVHSNLFGFCFFYCCCSCRLTWCCRADDINLHMGHHTRVRSNRIFIKCCKIFITSSWYENFVRMLNFCNIFR